MMLLLSLVVNRWSCLLFYFRVLHSGLYLWLPSWTVMLWCCRLRHHRFLITWCGGGLFKQTHFVALQVATASSTFRLLFAEGYVATSFFSSHTVSTTLPTISTALFASVWVKAALRPVKWRLWEVIIPLVGHQWLVSNMLLLIFIHLDLLCEEMGHWYIGCCPFLFQMMNKLNYYEIKAMFIFQGGVGFRA